MLVTLAQIETLKLQLAFELLQGHSQYTDVGLISRTDGITSFTPAIDCPAISSLELIQQLISEKLVVTAHSTTALSKSFTRDNWSCSILQNLGFKLAQLIAASKLTPENIEELLRCHKPLTKTGHKPIACGLGYFNNNTLIHHSYKETNLCPLNAKIIAQLLAVNYPGLKSEASSLGVVRCPGSTASAFALPT